MKTTPTLDQIRRDGLQALRERLGVAGMVRFLQQFEHGTGDYARERREWVDEASFEEIQAILRKPGRQKSRRSA